MERLPLGRTTRWVIKIGSSLVTREGRGLDLAAIQDWAGQIARLKQAGKEVVLVSSGAIAEGMGRLGWRQRPRALYELQAAAAVGQMGLVQAYESNFQAYGIHTAQVLLTHEDLSDRRRYINARTTLRTLLRLGIIPVINENDTVATDEIQLGDNDTLAALVANLIEAQLMVILTDTEGLYDGDPAHNPEARLIEVCQAADVRLDAAAGPTAGEFGRGGMVTKVSAARRAARSGAATVIASGRRAAVLAGLAADQSPKQHKGTLLLPGQEPINARKQWIANQLKVCGRLWLDEGASRVIRESGRSLLPVGVSAVAGNFARGEMVICLDSADQEVARGLVNYKADEATKIIGRPSSEIETALGYVDEPELIHRDNLVVV